MKISRIKYPMIDAISKIAGLILVAVSIDNASRGNYFIALFLFGLGGIISIAPVFIQVETSANSNCPIIPPSTSPQPAPLPPR